MKTISLLSALLLLSCGVIAQGNILLWPKGKMPNSKGIQLKDSVVGDQIYQFSAPSLQCYLAPKEKNTGAAILVIPGGGYLRFNARPDQVPAALYYQSMGINAFFVSYRLPTSPDLIHPEIGPLQDIQRAMRIIKANAIQWGIDSTRIGVFGTSAGGHGASTLATHEEDVSAIGDSLDRISFRPSFTILVSPVISFQDAIAHKGSRERLIGKSPSPELITAFSNENRVSSKTPPALLVHAHDDKAVSPLNSIVYYQALQAAGVSASLHIFPSGGHALTVQKNPGSAALWPTLSLEWLKEMKFISQ